MNSGYNYHSGSLVSIKDGGYFCAAVHAHAVVIPLLDHGVKLTVIFGSHAQVPG